MRISTWGSVNARKPRSCNNRLPAGKGYGVASAMRLIMDAAAIGVAQKEDEEQGIDEQDIFDRVVLFLAAITRRSVQQGLGGGRCAVPSRHGQKKLWGERRGLRHHRCADIDGGAP